jgi:hypothetical protein
MPKPYTPTSAAADVEGALRLLEGRWKLVILFHLFGGNVMRFSDLERAIPTNHSENAGAATSQLGSGRNRCADGVRPGAAEG